jgi:hypothetical protein
MARASFFRRLCSGAIRAVRPPRGWKTLSSAAVLSLAFGGAALASASASGERDWRALALADIEAMDHAVREVHIGYLDPAHPEMALAWDAAVREARARAAQVTNRPGWAAVLRRLGNSLRDPHASIRIGAESPPRKQAWTGQAVEYIAGRYWLRQADAGEDAAAERELLACDGTPIDELARRRLDLEATDWSVPANRSLAVPRLLVDDGNPFLPRLQRCELRVADEGRVETLAWREATAAEIHAAVQPYRRRRANERFELVFAEDGSAWISVPSFADSAGNAALREEIARQLERVRSAPYLVFDVRGNGGGSSQIASALSETLYGEGSLRPAPAFDRMKRWRASPRLLAALRQYRGAEPANPERDRFIDAVEPAIRSAVERGEALVDDPQSSSTDAPPAARRAAARTGPVFVLTDGGCSSACIMFVSEQRRMGARQVGDPTDRNTLYAEQWVSPVLPSGQAQFTLPSAWFGWPESERGGDPPDLPWTGRATDEAGLRRFIAANARAQR